MDVGENVEEEEDQSVGAADDREGIACHAPVLTGKIVDQAACQWSDDGADCIEEAIECGSFVIENSVQEIVVTLNELSFLINRVYYLGKHRNESETLSDSVAAGCNQEQNHIIWHP